MNHIVVYDYVPNMGQCRYLDLFPSWSMFTDTLPEPAVIHHNLLRDFFFEFLRAKLCHFPEETAAILPVDGGYPIL